MTCGYRRIFYLTAKSAGTEVARQAVAALRERGLRLRVLYLQAKERCCPYGADHPECSEEDCPYAADFYTRAEKLLPMLLAEEELSADYLNEAARAELLCPFELALELSLVRRSHRLRLQLRLRPQRLFAPLLLARDAGGQPVPGG